MDGDLHGPMTYALLEELCSNSSKKWDEVLIIAEQCLKQRIKLWDTILEQIN